MILFAFAFDPLFGTQQKRSFKHTRTHTLSTCIISIISRLLFPRRLNSVHTAVQRAAVLADQKGRLERDFAARRHWETICATSCPWLEFTAPRLAASCRLLLDRRSLSRVSRYLCDSRLHYGGSESIGGPLVLLWSALRLCNLLTPRWSDPGLGMQITHAACCAAKILQLRCADRLSCADQSMVAACKCPWRPSSSAASLQTESTSAVASPAATPELKKMRQIAGKISPANCRCNTTPISVLLVRSFKQNQSDSCAESREDQAGLLGCR